MRQYVPSTMRPKVTPEQLSEAASKLDDMAWDITCKRTQTYQILETLRPQIEKARSLGASWKQISEQVSNTTGYYVTKNMLSLHFTKKAVDAKAEKQLEEDATALAQAPSATQVQKNM